MNGIRTSPLAALISVLLVLGLPLAGAAIAGSEFSNYLCMPPSTAYTLHSPFHWPVFIILTAGIILVMAHPAAHIIRHRRTASAAPARMRGVFPWWGWAGIILCAASWFIAWTRLPVFAAVQRWTFTPLWLSYIIIVNAFLFMRTGRSLLTHSTAYLLKLFPLSSMFWWTFEYLNRFTANWYYTGAGEISALKYTAEASAAFSTALPAVMSTACFMGGFPLLYAGMDRYVSVSLKRRGAAWIVVLLSSCAGLGLTGVFPEILFPLLWVSPLLIVVSLSALTGRKTILSSIAEGDWRPVIILALSALVCGFFWEMWNINSMAKWTYSIPYVQGIKLFEMPLPGYAGYLPFGLECAVIAGLAGGCNEKLYQ